MAVWEAMHAIPGIIPVLAILAGAVAATIFSLALFLNRTRLVERIKQTELDLKRAGDGARAEDGRIERTPDAVIVNIHDRLVRHRQDLRRTDEQARLTRYVLVPLLAGSFLGIGHVIAAIRGLDHIERVTTQFQRLEHELAQWIVKGKAIEEQIVTQASAQARIATQAEASAQERETLQVRLKEAERHLAKEKQERIELELLLGKAEQRLAGLEEPHNPNEVEAGPVRSIEDPSSPPEDIPEPGSMLDLPREWSLEESDLYADSRMRAAVDGTSHYTGKLDGQIAFGGRQRQSSAPWSAHRIYVLVRWGVSSWIVTDGRATVNSDGAVEGAFRVILPLSTIRTLDVTAIATDTEYRRYQHVLHPDYLWKASTATIAVRRP